MSRITPLTIILTPLVKIHINCYAEKQMKTSVLQAAKAQKSFAQTFSNIPYCQGILSHYEKLLLEEEMSSLVHLKIFIFYY